MHIVLAIIAIFIGILILALLGSLCFKICDLIGRLTSNVTVPTVFRGLGIILLLLACLDIFSTLSGVDHGIRATILGVLSLMFLFAEHPPREGDFHE